MGNVVPTPEIAKQEATEVARNLYNAAMSGQAAVDKMGQYLDRFGLPSFRLATEVAQVGAAVAVLREFAAKFATGTMPTE